MQARIYIIQDIYKSFDQKRIVTKISVFQKRTIITSNNSVLSPPNLRIFPLSTIYINFMYLQVSSNFYLSPSHLPLTKLPSFFTINVSIYPVLYRHIFLLSSPVARTNDTRVNILHVNWICRWILLIKPLIQTTKYIQITKYQTEITQSSA